MRKFLTRPGKYYIDQAVINAKYYLKSKIQILPSCKNLNKSLQIVKSVFSCSIRVSLTEQTWKNSMTGFLRQIGFLRLQKSKHSFLSLSLPSQNRNPEILTLSQVLYPNRSGLECRCLEESMCAMSERHINTIQELGGKPVAACCYLPRKTIL